MKSFIPLLLLLLTFACTPQESKTVAITPQQIEAAIANGSFAKAESMIKEYLYQNNLLVKERQKWLFQIEKMDRIRMDFAVTEEEVRGYLGNFYDSIPDSQFRMWEEGKALEYKVIDGKKRYFNHAARNLFRISLVARKQWEKIHGSRPDSLQFFLSAYLPAVVKEVQAKGRALVNPVNMEVTYTLSVHPNAVPAGELVRAWMPMPRTDVARQSNVQLISANQPTYVLSPNANAHQSIYMEKRARQDEPTVFSYTFSYTSHAEWYDFKPADIKLYDAQSYIYQTYTLEQAPHILFSDRIMKITDELVGSEQNPYIKVKKIYDWIDKTFPWASAREYSTIDNIPEYVLDNNHGDCGQVTLLFITMARYAGIPARWQSGFMMHPGNQDLHDWAEVYYQGIGWVPVDQSFGRLKSSQNHDVYWFYTKGIDAFRLVVNQDTGKDFYPVKIHPRSETVDFQRGEVEWRGGNLYFNQWTYNMEISYKPVIEPASKPVKAVRGNGPDQFMLPFTENGYRRSEEYNRYGAYPDQASSSPSSYQLRGNSGNPAEDAIRNYNQRTYLRNNDGIRIPVDRYDQYDRYDPYDPYDYNDGSLSDYYSYMNRTRYPEDRYVPPSERSALFPGTGYSPSYRRDLQRDPRNTLSLPPLDDTRRFQTNPNYPYTDYGYRR